MSVMIDRPGTFRGKPLDWGVSESKNGFPQFVVKLSALEYYDEEAGEYIPWAEYEQEVTAYQILYSKDKAGQWVELLNAKQIKKAFGWDGKDFESLANGKFAETTVLFRVESSEYNGVTTLKVSWIDTPDASPTKTLPKYDTEKLKGLTAKMGGVLSAAAVVVPAKAPVGKPATPPKGKKGRPTAGPVVPPVVEKPAARSTGTPPPALPVTAPPAPSGNPSETKDSAWAAVNELKVPDTTDEKLAETWIAEGQKIGKPEGQYTSADWTALKDAVTAIIGIPF